MVSNSNKHYIGRVSTKFWIPVLNKWFNNNEKITAGINLEKEEEPKACRLSGEIIGNGTKFKPL